MLVASHNPDHCTESTMRQPTRTMCVAVKVGNAHLTLQPGRCKERGGRSWGKGGRKDPSQQKANRKAGSFVVLNTVQSQEGGSSQVGADAMLARHETKPDNSCCGAEAASLQLLGSTVYYKYTAIKCFLFNNKSQVCFSAQQGDSNCAKCKF